MSKAGGFVIVLVILGVLGSCGSHHGGDSSTPSQYHEQTVHSKDSQGHDVYHESDNMGGDFSCTFKADGASDCSGKP